MPSAIGTISDARIARLSMNGVRPASVVRDQPRNFIDLFWMWEVVLIAWFGGRPERKTPTGEHPIGVSFG
jgi:hypothetical protein